MQGRWPATLTPLGSVVSACSCSGVSVCQTQGSKLCTKTEDITLHCSSHPQYRLLRRGILPPSSAHSQLPIISCQSESWTRSMEMSITSLELSLPVAKLSQSEPWGWTQDSITTQAPLAALRAGCSLLTAQVPTNICTTCSSKLCCWDFWGLTSTACTSPSWELCSGVWGRLTYLPTPLISVIPLYFVLFLFILFVLHFTKLAFCL